MRKIQAELPAEQSENSHPYHYKNNRGYPHYATAIQKTKKVKK